MKSRSFTVILHKEENMYISECPEVGTVDQGETIEQAIAGLTEATRLYLEEFPLPKTFPRLLRALKSVMPKLPQISSREAIRALERLGFEQIR